MLMLRPGKLATPLTAAWVSVPDSVPGGEPPFVPIATVTLPVKLVAMFPWLSRAVTCGAGLIVCPATVCVGCTVKFS